MKKYSAFSLIELSIVILIIGILVAGVTQGSRLVKKMRVTTAQNLTTSSPVAGIRDLALWYETSLDSSFDSAESENNSDITNWYDNNPQSTTKSNALGSTAKPQYIEDAFNSALPAVRFNGTNDFMTFDGNILVSTNYTIFVVEQRRSNAVNYFMAGSSTVNNQNLHIGYGSNTSIRFSHYSGTSNTDFAVAAYTNPTPRIHTFRFSITDGRGYWPNVGSPVFSTNSSNGDYLPVTSYPDSALGRRITTEFFNGDIAEVIIFTRALKTEERQSVQSYLGKKYAISVTLQ